ncbi:P-loop containing nucleoside triphosphate hydrolase protein [Ceratobasidium sp. AG-I]|nr:P-loop containing nucleoside triphosphate hydrolase protein [Ceratobasidium sp. AG-I]
MTHLSHVNWETNTNLEVLDRIAETKLGIKLQEWQRLGTAQLLSGKNVLLLVATGSGKSTLFLLYALARPQAIVLVILPLKLLQDNMALNFVRKGLTAVALNEDTIVAAQEEGWNLRTECACGRYQIVLCSPEQLNSSNMSKLIEDKEFQSQVSMIAVDEVHLIPAWGGDSHGPAFRSAFNAIGALKRLSGPKFSFIKRDCERTNLHIAIHRIQYPYTQHTFADLDWLVQKSVSCPADIPKTIVCIDIVLRGHTLVAYLRSLLPPALQSGTRLFIHHLYASTCIQCKNDVTNEFLKRGDDSQVRIVVATEAFGCGVDFPDISRVVNFGTPQNLSTLYQRFGRAARNLAVGYCYVYVYPKLWDSISKDLGLLDRSKTTRRTILL